MSTKEENLKIVYNEIVELHRQHQSGIDLVYNKLNWILVSDLVFLASIYNMRCPSVSVAVLVSISVILSLVGFERREFRTTEKIMTQLERTDDDNFLEVLIEKKRGAFNKNESQNKKISDLMHYASWFLIIAVVLQCLLLIFK